ncbi:MAG TPA: hypothetical protein VKT82_23250 [Ktedonobacterales bacterium]|nr:hypothetical protein [Ktedonobacterales bacterium]
MKSPWLRGAPVLLLLVSIAGCGTYSPPAVSTPTTGATSNNPCAKSYTYDHLTDMGKAQVITDQEQDYNGSSGVETVKLDATKSATVTVSVSETTTISTEVDLDAVVAGVQQEVNSSVSFAVTASISNSPEIQIPAQSWGYGNYGVFVQVASGHLYSFKCHKDYGPNVKTYTPIAAGWCTWVTGGSSCASVDPTRA